MLTSSQQHPPRTNHTSHQDEPHIPSGRITHPLSTSHTYPLSTNHTSIQDESHIPSGRITRPLRTNCTFKTVLHQFHSSPSSTHKSLNHEPTAGSQFWTRRRAPFAVHLSPCSLAQRHSNAFQAASLSKTPATAALRPARAARNERDE